MYLYGKNIHNNLYITIGKCITYINMIPQYYIFIIKNRKSVYNGVLRHHCANKKL